jgi:formate dehydrogenase subunit beta
MSHKILKVKGGDVAESCNAILKELLESKKVHALLVPQETPTKKISFPVLISNPDQLNSDIFAPVLPVSTASIVSRITKFQAANKPIGVVMRPCQIRAFNELVKLNQANPENIIIIGVDCLGTFPVNTYTEFPEKKSPTKFMIDAFTKKTDDAEKYLRSACRVCKDPVPTNADVIIGIYGMDAEKEILIEAHTEAGKKLIDGLKLDEAKEHDRDKAVKAIHEHKAKHNAAFVKEKSSIKGIDTLATFFDKCVNCHNCMKACPICYCKECLFESSVFDAEAYKFLRKAESKGLFKMPSDSILFHLGRMNHMILSCVECGLCEQACPNNIPLMDVFIPAAENAQKEFNYQPGKDPKEKIPMIVYRENEFLEVGEK